MTVTPDLLTFDDGTPVSTPDQWQRRREELRAAIIPHEYGGLPPAGLRTEVLLRATTPLRGTTPPMLYRTYEVRTLFDGDRELTLTMSLWLPVGDGPFPVVLNGDGCWRYFNDGVVQEIVGRGNIAASFDRTQGAPDMARDCRRSGLYRLFPDASFGALSAWAWCYHRCVDALLGMNEVRRDAIAISGHSRGGKTALLAGATDERIALVNPNCSGAGGSGLHRLKAPGSEVIDAFFNSSNIFWFGEGFREYRHRDAQVPYDQHFLHAQVAPRLLLVTEAAEDHWANPPGSYAACRAAGKVYDLLGHPDNIAWHVRDGRHAHTPADFQTLLDFMDRHFHEREVARDFQPSLFPDLESLLRTP